MKVLHTSDWHLGRTLYGKKRYAEFTAMLDWLLETIQLHSVDVLLVAGDIFDTTTPSNRAQELYFRFLGQVAASSCRHVVITAGNHDSPSLLDAPRDILTALNVHVIGGVSAPQHEVLLLTNEHAVPELIVCAVPYLRDRDIRTVDAGESIEDKDRKLIEGIRAHYAAVATQADQLRAERDASLPIVAMGHLCTAGGQTVDGDGVRELYIGSLAHIPATLFPSCCDYVALGHLHVPQHVNNCAAIRYSGSPMPMGFGEAKQHKSVVLVEWAADESNAPQTSPTRIELLPVPTFQPIESIKGDWESISQRINELAATGSCAWLEVIYTGHDVLGDLRERLETAISGTLMDIIRVKNSRLAERVLRQTHSGEQLEDLNANDVFARCLTAHGVPEEQWPQLQRAYQETLAAVHEDDSRAH